MKYRPIFTGGHPAQARRGGILIEYAILIALLLIASIIAILVLGERNKKTFCDAADAVASYVHHRHAANCESTPPPPPPTPPAAIASATGPNCGEYMEGEKMTFSVTYDKIVFVDEAYIEIDIGGTIHQAALEAGSGTTTLIFSYTLTADDEDPDGIAYGDMIVHGEVLDETGQAAEGNFSDMAPDISCAKAEQPDTCTDNCRYVGTNDGYLIKIGDKGKEVWSKKVDSYPVYSVMVGPDGHIYTGSNSLKKLTPDGTVVWNVFTGGAMEIALTDDNDVIAVNDDGDVYAFKENGSRVTMHVPRIKTTYSPNYEAYSDYPTGLAVADDKSIYVTTYYGQFAKIDFATLQVLWSERWMTFETGHIGGVVIGENGKVYTTHWRPTTSSHDSSLPEYRDDAFDEYIIGWTDYAGSPRPSMFEAIPVEAFPDHIATGPDNRIVISIDNYNGFSGIPKVRAYESQNIERLWQASPYAAVTDLQMDKDGITWVMTRSSYRTYLYPLDAETGQQMNAQGTHQVSTTFDPKVISFALQAGTYF